MRLPHWPASCGKLLLTAHDLAHPPYGQADIMSSFIYPTDPQIIAGLAECMKSVPPDAATKPPAPMPSQLAEHACR